MGEGSDFLLNWGFFDSPQTYVKMENTWDFGLGPIGKEINSTGSAVGVFDVFNVGEVNVLSFEVLGLGLIMFVEFFDKIIKWRKPFWALSRL